MRKSCLFLLIFVLLSGVGFAFVNGDDDPIKELVKKLEQYREKHPQEKVHLHTDKPYYAIGDTIWFKAYVVTAERNQLSRISNILYVDLIDERDSIKKALRIPLKYGLGWGDFILADSLREGNYRLRAYTNWMRNYDHDYFFDKAVKVGNSLSSEVVTTVKYHFSITGMKQHVDADINYSNLRDEPYKLREVNYEIVLDHRKILKGKGTTDSTGNLKIKFTNAQPFVLKSGTINTVLKIDDRTLVKKIFPVKSTSNESEVQFLPEGGHLVNNIRSRIAFKAIGADGLSREVSGYIEDSNAKKVAQFSSLYAGLGAFGLTPVKGQKYTAIVKFVDGSEKKINLPSADEEGSTLSVVDKGESLLVNVSSASANEIPAGELIIVAQSNGVIHYVSRNRAKQGGSSATLSKKRFPAGVLQFTLFNSSYQPLAERLVFIRPLNKDELNLTTDKQVYGAREKVRLTLSCVDSVGKAQHGTFSLSVVNETTVPFDELNETTILSNLLLSSDLKGHIETPNYYFTDVNAEKDRAIDNLMLTQGWRRFEWKSLNAGILPSIVYKAEKDLSISGRVLSQGGAPIVGGKVTLFTTQGTGLLLDTITNAEGRFSFGKLDFNDSTTFVIQARNASDKKNVKIELESTPKALVSKSSPARSEINVNQSLLPYLKNRSIEFDEMRKHGLLRKSILLSEVKVSESRRKVTRSNNLNGPGRADAVLLAEDLRTCANLATCLINRVSGLIVLEDGKAYFLRNLKIGPVQLVLDGMYMAPRHLSTINPQIIESIEVLKSTSNTAVYGSRGAGGVIVVTTKRGSSSSPSADLVPGVLTYSPQGLHIARKFYSPTYPTQVQSSLPDFRSTIFWAPNLVTEEDGKVSVEFFTSDKPGMYKAVVEGIDLDGNVSRQVHRFAVK